MDTRHKVLVVEFSQSGAAPDTTAPTCTITCTQSSPSATTPLNFTFTFSEIVTGFVVGDITVGNGTAGNFAGSGAVYTADITPTPMSTVTVDVAGGVCVDGAGNGNTAASQFVIISTAPFTDAFTRGDGALANGWTGASWAISSNKVINTPALSSELVTNGTMETGSPPSSWSGVSATLTADADAHAGSQALKVTASGSNGDGRQTVTTTRYAMFKITGWAKSAAGNTSRFRIADAVSAIIADSNYNTWTSYTKFTASMRNVTTSTLILLRVETSGQVSLFDDLSLKEITLKDTFATRSFPVSAGTARVIVTGATGAGSNGGDYGGVVMCLDSQSAPTSGVTAYVGQGKIYMDKRVSGTVTNLLAVAAVDIVDGSVLKLVRSGNTFQLWYGPAGSETQRGADQTISDAAIISNTYHGIFATDASVSLDDFSFT